MVKKTEERKVKDIKNPNVESPFSWPLTFFIDSIKENGKVAEENVEAYSDYIKFLEVFNKTHIEKPEPTWTTKNKVRMDLHTLKLRDFSQGGKGIYTFNVPPYAGHTSTIVDFNT